MTSTSLQRSSRPPSVPDEACEVCGQSGAFGLRNTADGTRRVWCRDHTPQEIWGDLLPKSIAQWMEELYLAELKVAKNAKGA